MPSGSRGQIRPMGKSQDSTPLIHRRTFRRLGLLG